MLAEVATVIRISVIVVIIPAGMEPKRRLQLLDPFPQPDIVVPEKLQLVGNLDLLGGLRGFWGHGVSG